MLAPMHIRVLGSLAIFRGGLPVSLPEKQKALLGLLAAREHGEVSRSRIVQWLWPNSQPRSGRHSLSQAIYSLKCAGLIDAIRISSDAVALASHVTSDLAELRKSVTAEDWLQAASLIDGMLLSDLGHSSEALDDWIDQKRRGIHDAMVTVARHLCDELEFESALRIGQVALCHDPLDLHAVDIVVQSLVRMDRSEEAEAIACRTADRWSAEFQETITVEVPSQPKPASGGKAFHAFVGRKSEFKRLIGAWSRARAGSFCASFIIGEAGIGKTMAARRFQRLVALRGGRTAWAAGYVLERNVPFGVVDQWLRDLSLGAPESIPDDFSHFLGTIVPGLPPELEPLQVGRQRIHAGLALHIARAAEKTPLCLILDDIPWADDASLAFLHYLMRYHASLPLLLVGTARADGSLSLIREFDRAEEVYLQPLSMVDTAKLIEFKQNETSKPMPLAYPLDQIHRRTGGNPLLLTSLLADGAFLEDRNGDVPSSVVEFLLPRMDGLTTTAKVALAALGILPDPPRVSLHQIIGVDIAECEDALQELLRNQFIENLPEGLRVKHGLSAELALTLLPPPLEGQLRGRTARVLQEEGRSSPAALAAQFDVSGQRERAYETAVTAAAAAVELFAHKEAEFFFKLALSNAQFEEDSARVRLSLANLFLATGRKDQADQVLRDLNIQNLGSATALEVRVLQTIVDLSGAMDVATIARGRALLDALEGETAADLTARLALAIASAVYTQGDPDHILGYCASRTKELSGYVSDSRLRVGIAIRLGALVAMSESYEQGISQIDNVAAEAAVWPDTKAVYLAARGSACVAAGRLKEAERDFLTAAELMERTGTYESISMLANNLGVCYQEQGRFVEAAAQYDTALRIRDDTDAPSWVQVTYDNLGILFYEKGEYEAAIEVSSEGVAASGGGRQSVRSFISQQSIKGLSCLELGRRLEAQECRRELVFAQRRQGFWSNDVSYVEIFMARMAEMDGSIDSAVGRLRQQISQYEMRDFLCARRMEVELLRMTFASDPGPVMDRATALRLELAKAGAKNMVRRLDSIITRAKLRLP